MTTMAILCQTDEGLKALSPLLLEIWATPFFRFRDRAENYKNPYFHRFLASWVLFPIIIDTRNRLQASDLA